MTNSQNADTPTTHRLSHFPERRKRPPRFPFPNTPGNDGKRATRNTQKHPLTCKNNVSQDHQKRSATGHPGTFPVSPPSLEGKRERSPQHCDLVKHARRGIMSVMAAPKRDRRRLAGADLMPTHCRAHNRDGNPCERAPVLGAAVCWTHGGCVGHVRAKADERLADAAAEHQVRAILASVPLLDLDAEPVKDPAALVMRLAALAESGFVETAKRANAAVEAGREPADSDVALLKIFGGMARQLGTDMTRLQVGVQLASRYGAEAVDVEAVIEGEVPELPDTPDVSAIVARVLATEHELETERLVRVEQAKQGQLPAGLTIVGETEQAS